jgi:hypothetical protein
MYILDTDHLSVLERKGANAQHLLQRMRAIQLRFRQPLLAMKSRCADG